MTAMTSFNARGLTLTRIAPIFLTLIILYWFRDVWLPPVYDYSTSRFNAGASGKTEEEVSTNHDIPPPSDNPSWPSIAQEESQETDETTRPELDELLYDTSTPTFHFDEQSTSTSTSALHTSASTHPPAPHTTASNPVSHDYESCKNIPGADRVMVMLKTGATELYQKLPTHFMTTFRCIPNYMIFSDLEQTYADVPIYDAIAPITKSRKEQHGDFDTYHKILEWQSEGQDLSKLKGEGGWNLDKWKFMPMLHQTFAAADDNIDWFVMIEADTSLSWSNLLIYLSKINHKRPYYLGAQNWIGDTTFAHGGSGVIISRAAANALEDKRHKEGPAIYDQRWEETTSNSCCGDEIVARAFKELGILLSPTWPLIQGETPSTLDWTEGHWCAPVISWHHVTAVEVDQLYQFQMQWTEQHGWEKPYLYRDVFAHFVQPHITVNRTSWNNLSKDFRIASPNLASDDDQKFDELDEVDRKAIDSEAACAEACAGKDECIQWMFRPGRCQLGKEIRLGHSDDREDEHFVSGWMQERVEEKERKGRDCKIRWEPSELIHG